MSQLYELVYTSVPTRDLSSSELETLLKRAQLNNDTHGITGMLAFDGQRFMQILEGTEETVSALYKLIETDPRHTDVEVLHQSNMTKRAYSDWTMAFGALPKAALNSDGPLLSELNQNQTDKKFSQGANSYGAAMFSLFLASGLELSGSALV